MKERSTLTLVIRARQKQGTQCCITCGPIESDGDHVAEVRVKDKVVEVIFRNEIFIIHLCVRKLAKLNFN